MKSLFDELADIYKEIESEVKKEASRSQKVGQPSKNISLDDLSKGFQKGFRNLDKERRNTDNNSKSFQPSKRFDPKTKSNKSTTINAPEGDYQTSPDMKNVRTLRDRVSNLEDKKTYIDIVGTRNSKLAEYASQIEKNDAIEDKADNKVAQTVPDIVIPGEDGSNRNKEVTDGVVLEVIDSFKSEDKLLSAKKAFLYSEIFNRKF